MSEPSSVTEGVARPAEEVEAPAGRQLSVPQLIGIGLATRLLIDTSVQIFFPFLPVIAEGMGTSTITLGRLVSVRSSMGMISPLFGVLADRRGYRAVMRLGLLLAAAGYLAVGLSTNLWLAAAGMILAGLGTFAFVPTLMAYLSARLPYDRRARGLGILEYAWALAGIVGLFLVGQLIAVASWRVPFFILSGGLFLAYLFYRILPSTTAPSTTKRMARPLHARLLAQERVRPDLAQLQDFLELGANSRSAWSALVASGLIMFAAMHLFISYGTWLLAEYNLGPAQLGQVALILGVADLSGSVLVSLVGDRLGKRRSVLSGATVAFVGYALLPIFNVAVLPAILGLILARFAFEFTIVSNLTMISEQAPAQRGKMLTLGAAAALLGSTVAGFTGPWTYASYGVLGLGTVSAVAMVLTLVIILLRVREAA